MTRRHTEKQKEFTHSTSEKSLAKPKKTASLPLQQRPSIDVKISTILETLRLRHRNGRALIPRGNRKRRKREEREKNNI